MSLMHTTKEELQRDVFRKRVFSIAQKAGAHKLDEFKLPNGDSMLVFWPGEKSRSKGQILVTIGEDYCFHYLQGGGKWEDLELDFGTPVPFQESQ